MARLTSNPTSLEVAEHLLAKLLRAPIRREEAVQLAQQVVRLIYEEKETSNLLVFKAGHTAGIETCSTGTFDIPVESKYEGWMADDDG